MNRFKKATAITASMFVFATGFAFSSETLYNLNQAKMQAIVKEESVAQRLDSIKIEYPVEIKPMKVETVEIIEEEPTVNYYDVPLSKDLQDYIRAVSEEYSVSMDLVIALIEHESKFDPNCISSTNDYGLMQVNACNYENVAKIIGDWEMLDPFDNVHAGIVLLSNCIDKSENLHIALIKYNQGTAGANTLTKQGIYSTDYSRSIVEKYNKIKKSV